MKKTFKTLALISTLALSMTACSPKTPVTAEPEEDIVVTTVETTLPEVTTTAVTTTETTTTPEITTTEATTTTVITTTVPEITTTVPETTTVVTTTTAPVTTTTVATTPVPSYLYGYDEKMTQEWIDATNAERRRVGLPEYKINESLMECAAIRAKEMCDNNYHGHTRPNGDIWSTVLIGRASGIYQNETLNGKGENVGRTWIDLDPNGQSLSNAYANSPGHYKNMINKVYVYVGASIYHEGNGRYYSCMIFTT